MAGRTFLMDGQSISNDEQYSSDEGDQEEEEEMEYMHASDIGEHEKQQNQYEQQYDDGVQYEDHHDGDEGGFDSHIEEEQVPSMPTGFYSEVDEFLSRPPPGISKAKASKGGKTNKVSPGEEHRKKSSERSLPNISDSTQLAHVQCKVSSRRTGPGAAGKKAANRVLDERLLQQAFEYSNKLQQEAMVEEVYEASLHMRQQKSSSAPQLRPPQHEHDHEQQSRGTRAAAAAAGAGGQRKPRSADTDPRRAGPSAQAAAAYGLGKKKPANSIVRRLRSKTQTSASGQSGKQPPRNNPSSGGFDTSCDVESATSTRNVTDFDSLVANFEQGTHLQQLREELERSQASMAQSRRAMQDISKEMAGKLRI